MDWSKKNRPNCVHERGDILGALAGATFLQRRSGAHACVTELVHLICKRAPARVSAGLLWKSHRGCIERKGAAKLAAISNVVAACDAISPFACMMCGAAASMAGWRRNLRVHRPRGRNMAGQGDLARLRHVPGRSVFTYWVWGTRLRAGTRSRASLDWLHSAHVAPEYYGYDFCRFFIKTPPLAF